MPLFGRRTAEQRERRKRREWGLVAPPRPEADGGDPRLPAVREAARSGDWARLRGLLAPAAAAGAAPGGACPWTDDLSRLADELMEVPGAEEWLARAVAADPKDPLARLALGARQVGWAWEARSRRKAKYVSREQFEVFHARLLEAEDHLYEAAQLVPEWVAPWYFLLPAGRGLEVGQEVAERRMEAVTARFPHHLPAHRAHLQQVCAKWGGSHEKMHGFARTAMLAAPEGSPLGELVALAQLEQWYEEPAGDDERYLNRPEVAEQLHEAWSRSLGHPDFRPFPGWTLTGNTFAMTFAMAGRKDAAVAAFRMLNGAVTRSPWNHLRGGGEDPVGVFTQWQARMLR